MKFISGDAMVVKVRGFSALLAIIFVCLIASSAHCQTYRLLSDSYLDVGNQWTYQVHTTLEDNVAVNKYDTQTEAIVGTKNVAGYSTKIRRITNSVDNYDGYYGIDSQYFLEYGYDDYVNGEHLIVISNNPGETLPIWINTSDNNRYMGTGNFQMQLDDPAMSWWFNYTSYVTYLRQETITVGVGSFDCIVVQSKAVFNDEYGFNGEVLLVDYIDPNIGIIKEEESFWMYNPFDGQTYNSESVKTLTSTNIEPPLPPQIGISYSSDLDFVAYGKSDTNVDDQIIWIYNDGDETLNWQIEIPNDVNWLSVSPTAGQVMGGSSVAVTLSVDPNEAPEYGYNYATINVVDDNASNSPVAVDVSLYVNGPSFNVSPASLDAYAEEGKTAEGRFVISNTGYDVLHWSISVPNDVNWLSSVSPTSGECSRGENSIITVAVNLNDIEFDDFGWQDDVRLTIDSPSRTSPYNYYVNLYVYEPNEIHVPMDYPTLQQAVDAARDIGDIIIVHPGKYEGCGIYNKTIEIQSVEPDNMNIVNNTIITSEIYYHSDISKKAMKFNGLSFIGNASSAIYFDGVGDLIISNCIVKGWGSHGIWIAGISKQIYINNCLITDNYSSGIRFDDNNSDTLISNCTIADNRSTKYNTASCISIINNLDRLVIANSILKNSESVDSFEIEYLGYANNSHELTISNSNIYAGPNSVYIEDANFLTLNYNSSNVEGDPCFAANGYISDNNTPSDANDDYWVDGDYHLQSEYGRYVWNGYSKADFNMDGQVNLIDFAYMAKVWNLQSTNDLDYYPYDLNNDYDIDTEDLAMLAGDYLTPRVLGEWVYDDVTSACIDAGDVNDVRWKSEMWPHGGRVNIGYYGGTPQASMSASDIGNVADLNKDDVVDMVDYAEFSENAYQLSVPSAEDMNLDGYIDLEDLFMLAENWLVED